MANYNVVAVIPIKGRLELLTQTIKRLKTKNNVSTVICVGETLQEKNCVQKAGGVFVIHRNEPLGAKWNYGFISAKKYNPDAVLFVGSSDWISDNWLDVMMSKIESGADLVGKKDFYLLDIATKTNQFRSCHWLGYGQGVRLNEPIGIGRVISASILEKINWSPFDKTLNNSMDWSMYSKVLSAGGKVEMIDNNELVSLSISTDQWINKHKFENHWRDAVPSKTIRIDNQFIFDKFPEYKLIFTNDNRM